MLWNVKTKLILENWPVWLMGLSTLFRMMTGLRKYSQILVKQQLRNWVHHSTQAKSWVKPTRTKPTSKPRLTRKAPKKAVLQSFQNLTLETKTPLSWVTSSWESFIVCSIAITTEWEWPWLSPPTRLKKKTRAKWKSLKTQLQKSPQILPRKQLKNLKIARSQLKSDFYK